MKRPKLQTLSGLELKLGKALKVYCWLMSSEHSSPESVFIKLCKILNSKVSKLLQTTPPSPAFRNFIFYLHITTSSFSCDVTSREKCFELAATVRLQVGVVSILVNNAGIMPAITILQQTEQDIRRTYDINVLAHLWVSCRFD